MELLLDVGIIISDFVVGIFSGDEWKKIVKFVKKKN